MLHRLERERNSIFKIRLLWFNWKRPSLPTCIRQWSSSTATTTTATATSRRGWTGARQHRPSSEYSCLLLLHGAAAAVVDVVAARLLLCFALLFCCCCCSCWCGNNIKALRWLSSFEIQFLSQAKLSSALRLCNGVFMTPTSILGGDNQLSAIWRMKSNRTKRDFALNLAITALNRRQYWFHQHGMN